MKVGIIGATGKSGRLITAEAQKRGLDVTAIVRDASKLDDTSLNVIEKDIFDLTTEDLKSFDVVVNAFGTPLGQTQPHIDAGRVLIQALSGTTTRLVVLGGAGSLYVDESKTKNGFAAGRVPDFAYEIALGQAQNLEDLQATTDLNWTFVSPSAFYDPEGPRTGRYRTGTDVMLYNSEGESYLSYPDMALAIVDEVEHGAHLRQQMTVVSEKQ
ncbi:NAD(P)-dependent oxidoreductase [Staphylococcus lutrae]|uniref:NAD(P)-binding domain-containing protein n=1 Tax=Staphylococcus lutrae TaxID=155085 RepID=A0AAC9WJ96_9STAP|nr:NAD(P)H-binding protein [Staphylococcus lutrae]ARJ50793.1 hypothetical protein B5P37_05405 [Staphylococcus lutrae]PNZ34004.1 hypothetical protein CD134_11695 [Staphylococcus lutrae]